MSLCRLRPSAERVRVLWPGRSPRVSICGIGEFMNFVVKEIFYTLQGEGANVGRPAVFCRFAGCNLWSGSEPDRDSAVCSFCDTDFVGTDGVNGGTFRDAAALASVIADQWLDPRVLPRFVA